MNQFFYQITRKASEIVNSDDYRKRNITRKTAFTRNRKLTFPVMIVLILNFLTRTMQIELDDFFANVLDADLDSVTKQAFFKARKNILPDAFRELFLMTRDMVLNKNKIKRHKEYSAELTEYGQIRTKVLELYLSGHIPTVESLDKKINALIQERSLKDQQFREADKRARDLADAQRTIEEFLRQERNEQQQERKRKKNGDLE